MRAEVSPMMTSCVGQHGAHLLPDLLQTRPTNRREIGVSAHYQHPRVRHLTHKQQTRGHTCSHLANGTDRQTDGSRQCFMLLTVERGITSKLCRLLQQFIIFVYIWHMQALNVSNGVQFLRKLLKKFVIFSFRKLILFLTSIERYSTTSFDNVR